MDYMVIAVDSESADIFGDFAHERPDLIFPVEHKGFNGSNEIMEFIVAVGPAALSALGAYLVARLQYTKKELKIKKGDTEIELKGYDIAPSDVMDILLKLEHKKSDEQ